MYGVRDQIIYWNKLRLSLEIFILIGCDQS